MGSLFVANWEDRQTYRKDRGAPPWIKVYRNLFTNKKWAKLSDAEKGQLVSIWILAADDWGRVENDPAFVRRVCMLDEEPDLNKFIELGFLLCECQPNVNQMSAKCQPNDAPETETETETEKRQKRITLEELSVSHISDWLKKNRDSGKYVDIDEDVLLDKFRNWCLSKNKTYKDYVSAYKNSFHWDNPPKRKTSSYNDKLIEEQREAMRNGTL